MLTDFGTQDHFVAAMKGVILGRAPDAALVDVTHEVPPQDVETAAFLLLAAHDAFPPGTVHLAVVDPGVGSDRRAVVVDAGGQRFVGPDNGLFGPVLDRYPAARVHHAADGRLFRHPVSDTFHGRDVFAPVAGSLAAGLDAAEVGPEVGDPVRLDLPRPERTADGARGAVLHVDRFGNCVTNLSRAELPGAQPGADVRVEVAGRVVRGVRRFYAGAEAGEPFALWGSAGLLELSVNRGSAAEALGVRRGDTVRVRVG